MRRKNFNFTWFEKRRFSSEKKSQLRHGIARYSEDYDASVESFWIITRDLPNFDTDQKDVLSEFSKKLVLK